jgi:hypothetical protein
MPKIIQGNQVYECKFCSKRFKDLLDARNCEATHDIVYVPFERQDLKRLTLFINTGEVEVLTNSLLNTIMKYNGLKQE